jgi:hypothetical protein
MYFNIENECNNCNARVSTVLKYTLFLGLYILCVCARVCVRVYLLRMYNVYMFIHLCIYVCIYIYNVCIYVFANMLI